MGRRRKRRRPSRHGGHSVPQSARMAASYVVRPLSPHEASEGARAWNHLADMTLAPQTVSRIETLLAQSGSSNFAAFGAEASRELCGIATARVISHPLNGERGEIEALMIDGRLPIPPSATSSPSIFCGRRGRARSELAIGLQREQTTKGSVPIRSNGEAAQQEPLSLHRQ